MPPRRSPGDARAGCGGRGIARLNRRYGPTAAGERFLLFHRRRLWNAIDGQWMGRERKRGKLHELNRLLRGATDNELCGERRRPPSFPIGVRYIITLDADTRLPRDAVRRLVGKMVHPLNHPAIRCRPRTCGGGIPWCNRRVAPSLPVGREGSVFQRLSGAGGIDPYSAVSDVGALAAQVLVHVGDRGGIRVDATRA